MIDFNAFSNEVFQILRSYEKDIVLYDDNGTRVFEPEQARRMYVIGDNLLVSIVEDGDNSALKFYLSPSFNLSQVEGLLETLRRIAVQSNLLFHVKKYNKEIKPKDFAVQSAVKEQQEIQMNIMEGLYGTSKSSYLKLENARMIVRHSERVNERVIGDRGRHISSIFVENMDGERFRFPVNMLSGARAMTNHVNNGGTFADEVGTQIIRMARDFGNLAQVAQGINARPGIAEAAKQKGPKIEAYGVKSVKSKPWRKTFANQAAYEKFFDNADNADDIEVQGMREIEGSVSESVTHLLAVRRAVYESLTKVKRSFDRMYESKTYMTECQRVVDAASLMETSDDLTSKVQAWNAILGEGFDDEVMLSAARMVVLPESQEIMTESDDDISMDSGDDSMDSDLDEEETDTFQVSDSDISDKLFDGSELIGYDFAAVGSDLINDMSNATDDNEIQELKAELISSANSFLKQHDFEQYSILDVDTTNPEDFIWTVRKTDMFDHGHELIEDDESAEITHGYKVEIPEHCGGLLTMSTQELDELIFMSFVENQDIETLEWIDVKKPYVFLFPHLNQGQDDDIHVQLEGAFDDWCNEQEAEIGHDTSAMESIKPRGHYLGECANHPAIKKFDTWLESFDLDSMFNQDIKEDAARFDRQATFKAEQQVQAALDKNFHGYFDAQTQRDGSVVFKQNGGVSLGQHDEGNQYVLSPQNLSKAIGPIMADYRRKGWTFTQPVGGEFIIGVPAHLSEDAQLDEVFQGELEQGDLVRITARGAYFGKQATILQPPSEPDGMYVVKVDGKSFNVASNNFKAPSMMSRNTEPQPEEAMSEDMAQQLDKPWKVKGVIGLNSPFVRGFDTEQERDEWVSKNENNSRIEITDIIDAVSEGVLRKGSKAYGEVSRLASSNIERTAEEKKKAKEIKAKSDAAWATAHGQEVEESDNDFMPVNEAQSPAQKAAFAKMLAGKKSKAPADKKDDEEKVEEARKTKSPAYEKAYNELKALKRELKDATGGPGKERKSIEAKIEAKQKELTKLDTQAVNEAKEAKKYPDTKAGVLNFCKDEMSAQLIKKLDLPKCKIHHDPSIDGVWAIDNVDKDIRVIVYMAGYMDTTGKLTTVNDFEECGLNESITEGKSFKRNDDEEKLDKKEKDQQRKDAAKNKRQVTEASVKELEAKVKKLQKDHADCDNFVSARHEIQDELNAAKAELAKAKKLKESLTAGSFFKTYGDSELKFCKRIDESNALITHADGSETWTNISSLNVDPASVRGIK